MSVIFVLYSILSNNFYDHRDLLNASIFLCYIQKKRNHRKSFIQVILAWLVYYFLYEFSRIFYMQELLK